MPKYTVSIYDFRSKQEYIYRTNKVQEIMGASEIMKNAYKRGILDYGKIEYYDWDNVVEIPDFSLELFQGAVERKKTGMVLYEGGGNVVIMFLNDEECIKFNKHFSMFLLREAPGLTPMCKMACIDDLKNKTFSEVMKEVFNGIDSYNQIPYPILSANVLPFTQIDRKTSQPVVYKKEDSITAESLKKIEAFKSINEKDESGSFAKNFDEMIEKKGKESLLAVIYIDGNGLGQYVKDYITDDIMFEEGVVRRRELTMKINNIFVNGTMGAIVKQMKKVQQDFKPEDKKVLAMRRIISAGDEITIVCNARYAYMILKKYFETIESSEFSACAGVVVSHSHAPFSEVYAIAEECCNSGKELRKKICINEEKKNNSYIDAYYCYSAITSDLETLRERVGADYSNMPYCIRGIDDQKHMLEGEFERIGNELKKVNRTNVKALRDAAYKSKEEFELELMRVKANCSERVNIEPDDLASFCDAAEFYDLWFGEEK